MPTSTRNAGQKPTILFKTDATEAIGLGHLTRSLALADVLLDDFDIHFFISTLGFAFFNQRNQYQHHVHHCEFEDWEPLEKIAGEQPHIVIIDDYRVADSSILNYRIQCPNALVLATDDEGERFDSPVYGLLNVGFRSEVVSPPPRFQSTSLWGAQFNPINKRFWGRRIHRTLTHPIQTLGVTMGGSDPECQGERILELAETLLAQTTLERILFVLGPAHADPIAFTAKVSKHSHIEVIHNPPDIIDVFNSVDAMLTSAGGTTFELGLLGIPQIVLPVADNQRPTAKFLKDRGFASVLPSFNQLSDTELMNQLVDRVTNVDGLRTRAQALCSHLHPINTEENTRSIANRIRHVFDASPLYRPNPK